MLETTLNTAAVANRATGSTWKRPFRVRTLSLSFCIVAAIAAALFLLLKPATLVDLAEGHNMHKYGIFSAWDHGDLVVLVRHAERCDHSDNPCLARNDGITVIGSEAAAAVGKGFNGLGLTRTDIISSPSIRALQTSQFMLAEALESAPVANQTWLSECRKNILTEVLAHKSKQRNLMLITHSECMSSLEKELKMPDTGNIDYGNAMFLKVDSSTGKATLLGMMPANRWQHALGKREAKLTASLAP